MCQPRATSKRRFYVRHDHNCDQKQAASSSLTRGGRHQHILQRKQASASGLHALERLCHQEILRLVGLPADPRSLSGRKFSANLIENAARHGHSRVRIGARQDGQVFIEDDGPGVTGTWDSFECDLARFDALGLG